MIKCEECPGFRKDIDVNIDISIKKSEEIFFQVNIQLNSIRSMIKIISIHHVARKDNLVLHFALLKLRGFNLI